MADSTATGPLLPERPRRRRVGHALALVVEPVRVAAAGQAERIQGVDLRLVPLLLLGGRQGGVRRGPRRRPLGPARRAVAAIIRRSGRLPPSLPRRVLDVVDLI